jgi:hypothetical protein
MSNFSNQKKIGFSFSKSRIYTNRNLKNDYSIPFVTGLYNENYYQKQVNPSLPESESSTRGLYTYWADYNINDKDFFKDIQIKEHDINLNSADRDISVNLNPLNFTVWLNPGNTRTKSFLPNDFKNVKYLNFEHIIFPKFIQLNKFLTSSDISANIYSSDISNNLSTITIDSNISSLIDSNISYQICNVVKTNLTAEINFTVNYNKCMIYTYKYNYINSTYSLDKYIPIYTKLNTYIQYICIQPTNNKFIFNTKSISVFRQVYPKLNSLSDLYFAIKKSLIVYKNTDLLNFYKFNIKLLDSNYEQIIIQNLDTNVVYSNRCTCCYETSNIKYSCKCYYLRHPLHDGFQIELFIKLGCLVQELNKKSYLM